MRLRHWGDCAIYQCCKFGVWLLCHTYFRVTYRGRENLPGSGAALLACHHSSYIDPVVIGLGVPRIVSYLAREDLFRTPLKWLIRHLFAYPISRDSSDLRAIKQAQKLLKEGSIVLLFPEGTRTDNGRVKEFKAGVGLVALRAQVPVVPVYVQGAYQLWPRRQKFPRPGRMRVYYGPPLLPADYAEEPRNRTGFTRIARELEERVKNLEKEARL